MVGTVQLFEAIIDLLVRIPRSIFRWGLMQWAIVDLSTCIHHVGISLDFRQKTSAKQTPRSNSAFSARLDQCLLDIAAGYCGWMQRLLDQLIVCARRVCLHFLLFNLILFWLTQRITLKAGRFIGYPIVDHFPPISLHRLSAIFLPNRCGIDHFWHDIFYTYY